MSAALDGGATSSGAILNESEISSRADEYLIPGFLLAPAERFVNRALDDVLKGVNMDHKYAPTLTDGQAAVGTP